MIRVNSLCIGCKACYDICTSNAVVFNYDVWGQGRASINEEKCTHCGLCKSICPMNVAKVNERQEFVYAAVSRENNKTGSSGGIFYELAKTMIENGGVVYGAAFDEQLKLIHKRASIVDEIIPLCKSKYIYSNMENVYKSVAKDLKENRKVLFVGTPCQTSAVKNIFSGKYSENLIVIDFLCHGAGTQKVFDCCVSKYEEECGCKIEDFCFRAKSRKSEHSFSMVLKKNGKTLRKKGYAFEFPYYYSYLKYSIFDDTCYKCIYSQESRVGDITIGDFWKIQKYDSKLDDKKGVSMLSVNTSKGEELLNSIRLQCDLSRYPLKYASSNNESFLTPVRNKTTEKENLRNLLESGDEKRFVEALSCKNVRKSLVLAKMPMWLKKIYGKVIKNEKA